VTRLEDAGPNKKRVSLSFDLRFKPIAGSGKLVRFRGRVEDAVVTDIGEAVGLLAVTPEEMRILSASDLPAP
jgi:hypothetical protein